MQTSDKVYPGKLSKREYLKNYYQKHKSHLQAQKKVQQKEKRLKYLLRTLNHRCNSPKHISYRWYGGKGIKNFLTLEDLQFLWQRDNAEAMKKPLMICGKTRLPK